MGAQHRNRESMGEGELEMAHSPDTRKIAMRTAMVMAPGKGGVFQVLYNMTRAGLGGSIGGGRQFVSWIHGRGFLSRRAICNRAASAFWGRQFHFPASPASGGFHARFTQRREHSSWTAGNQVDGGDRRIFYANGYGTAFEKQAGSSASAFKKRDFSFNFQSGLWLPTTGTERARRQITLYADSRPGCVRGPPSGLALLLFSLRRICGLP